MQKAPARSLSFGKVKLAGLRESMAAKAGSWTARGTSLDQLEQDAMSKIYTWCQGGDESFFFAEEQLLGSNPSKNALSVDKFSFWLNPYQRI
jgi:hypothetical protein